MVKLDAATAVNGIEGGICDYKDEMRYLLISIDFGSNSINFVARHAIKQESYVSSQEKLNTSDLRTLYLRIASTEMNFLFEYALKQCTNYRAFGTIDTERFTWKDIQALSFECLLNERSRNLCNSETLNVSPRIRTK